jgi:hypothetical protein
MLCLMLDTQTALEDVVSDTARGPYPRLSPAAVERAKTKLDVAELDTIATALGFSRMNFWRVRHGLFDIRYSHALRVAQLLDMPIDEVFDGGRDA